MDTHNSTSFRRCSKCSKLYPLTSEYFYFQPGRGQFKTICRNCIRLYHSDPEQLRKGRERYYRKYADVQRRPYKKSDLHIDTTLTERERLIRAAAFIETEGSIQITRSFVVKVTMTSTTPAMLTWMRDNFGGSISAKRVPVGWKKSWEWVATTFNAEKLLQDILPFMLIKREQAQCALELRALQGKNTCRGRTLDEKIVDWQPYYDRMRKLNARGEKSDT